MSNESVGLRIARNLAASLPLMALLSSHATFAADGVAPAGTAEVLALRANGADLEAEIGFYRGAPAKLAITLETAAGVEKASVIVGSMAPARVAAAFPRAVERFALDGFDYRIRLRDAAGREVAPPAPFTVSMSCDGPVCRFVPELGVTAGGAVWMDSRLATALRAGDAASTDLLASAVEEDPSLLGAARDLAFRLAGEADGSCRCRWAYSTTPAACGGSGISLGIYDRGVREDGLSARRIWKGAMQLETACWTARRDGDEKIRLSLGERGAAVSWPRVRLAPCGACAGVAQADATFLGGASALAEGIPSAATRSGWSFAVDADGGAVLGASDGRAATTPNGDDRFETIRTWAGTAGAIEWQVELWSELQAPRGIDRGIAEARVAYAVRSTGEAACAVPPRVEVGRISGPSPFLDPLPQPIDPDQISVVIGECRPPR